MRSAFRLPLVASIFVFAAVCMLSPAAKAAYILTPSSGGSPVINVNVGGSFVVDYTLSSDASDEINSAIWQTTFSAVGLRMVDYDWTAPFPNEVVIGGNDDSNPHVTNLPVTLAALSIESSNFASNGSFNEGILLSIEFMVPLNWAGPNQVIMNVVPDTFAFGFDDPISTIAGDTFLVNITPVPEPMSAQLACMAFIAATSLPQVRRSLRRRVHRPNA